MTSRELWVRVRPLLDSALELPAQDRRTHLGRICRDDALREAALRILDAREVAHRSLGFLESPAVELAAPLLALEVESHAASGELTPGIAVGPYVLEKRLGAGGMGVVYLARDPRLDRSVALKLLPAWLPVDDESHRRLIAEAKAASRLDHPNIQTVFEIGSAPDGSPFIAMASSEGETVAERLGRGPLDERSALDLTRQMVDGLAAAHAHGIVHRDVKPGNLMVTSQGLLKLLDFGAATMAGGALKRGGGAIGTVSYMSPEQTRGDDVDARTDVWSLGVVAYEMLAGRRPFSGDDAESVIRAIREQEPTPLESLRPDTPAPLLQVVHRCLQKDAGARYENAARVLDVLRGFTGRELATVRPRSIRAWRRWSRAAVIAAFVLTGAAILRAGPGPDAAGETTAGPPVTTAHRLAVLPLSLPGDEPDGAYLSDAITEALVADLGGVDALGVTGLGAVKPYRGSTIDARELARILDVGWVLTGSVEETDDRIGLSLRLMDATTPDPIWSVDYVTSFAELPNAVGLAVEGVSETLRAGPSHVPPRLAAPSGPRAGEALRAYLEGKHFLEMLDTPGASQRARELFEQSIRLDSTYAPAWSGLSGAVHQLVIQGAFAALDAEPFAMDAAERALALDPTLAEAHTHMAAELSWFGWDGAEADRYFRRAIELDPNSARTHRFFAVHLRNHRRFQEALDMIRIGAELDPLSPGAYLQEGIILHMAGRYDEALATYRQLLDIHPEYQITYFHIALTYVQMGRFDAALEALGQADPDDVIQAGVRTSVLIQAGRRDVALAELARLESLPPTGTALFNRALIHSTLGEDDRALDLLEQAVAERPWQLQLLAVEPSYQRFRTGPYAARFEALLERVGLPTG